MSVVDLFAGPGGWDIAARDLGLDVVGIEWDGDACQTRRNAELGTVHDDVSELDPADYSDAAGLIASPPCPAFSAAGKGEGRDHIPDLVEAIHRRNWTARPSENPEVWLTLEVGRWYDTLNPVWVALEQVPAVLPLWEAYAHVLADDGYSTWCGVLNAADYGVPQTRRRAILIASRERSVSCPPPTHAQFPQPSLFGDELAAWVTMAEALGWGVEPPSHTVTGGGSGGGGPEPFANKTFRDELAAVVNTGRDWQKGGTRADAQTIDAATQPAPTLTGLTGRQWLINRRDSATWKAKHGERRNRHTDEPSSLTGEAHRWHWTRPVAGSQYGENSVRLTIADALTLQTFPADYPLHGTQTSQFKQIGNAIPPLLAWHILKEARS